MNNKLTILFKEKEKKEMESFVEIFKSQPNVLLEWNEYIGNMLVINVKVYPSKELGVNFYNGKN